MRFAILGPLQVWRGDRPVELGAPKQRAVLAALLVSANRVVSLDRLIDQLWGDEAPPAATSSLQAYVANLRRVLEPDRVPRTPPTVLITRSPGYLLQVDPADVDAVRFVDLVERGRARLADDPRAAYELLDQALGLWRGPALQEFSDYDFAAAEIKRLEEARTDAAEAHAEALLALGGHAQVVPALEVLLAEHPWRERLRELLMLALYRCGRQADALEVMVRTRRELDEGLGIAPGAGLQRLHAAILRQDSALDWRQPPAQEAAMVAEVSRPVPQDDPTPGLVGRTKPLAVLRNALHKVIAGHGRLLLVAGEPGIGKTRLLQELAAEAESLRVDVAWGRCYDVEATPPFWPWVQVLRALSAARGGDEVLAAASPGGASLVPLVPELISDGAPADTPPDQARLVLYDAATRMLGELARRRPLAILVEDLHWADTPSLELLGYIAGQLHDLPALVVGTFREESAGEGPLAAMLAAVARETSTERLRLDGLQPAEVGKMLARRCGGRIDERAALALHERTSGNPFFVTELTRLLDSERTLDDPASWPVPDGIRDVLRRRIARLPRQAVALLSVAAIVGRSFDFDVLARVTGTDDEQVLDAVDAAVITGLLVEHPELPGRYRFVHALVRETLYDELSAMRRARLHARVGAALHEIDGEGQVDALAHHFWHAGPAVAPASALPFVWRAAEAAERALAVERALEQWRRTVSLIERLPASPERDAQELDARMRLANLLVRARGYTAAGVSADLARVRDLARATGRTAELTRALWGLGSLAVVLAEPARAEMVGEELLRLGRETGDRAELLAGYDTLGTALLFQGKLEDADEHAAEGIRLADELGAVPLFTEQPVVALRGFRSVTRLLLGDAESARALRAEALAQATAHDEYTHAFALMNAAHLAVYERDVEATRQWATEGIALCEEHGFDFLAAICGIFDAWAGAQQGEAGSARIRAALDALAAAGARTLRHFYLGLCAEAELAEGRPDDAKATLEEAIAEADATGERVYEPALHRLRDRLGVT